MSLVKITESSFIVSLIGRTFIRYALIRCGPWEQVSKGHYISTQN